MLPKLFRFLWGDINREELKKFGLLSSCLFFIVGTYWMMRTMKNAIFTDAIETTYGKDYISRYLGYAKIFSPLILVCLILIYSKLVDYLEKHTLVYVIAPFYACIFLGIAYGLSHPTFSKSPILGWITYFAVESFASLVVALFWSFVASSMDTAMAKKGFPIIVFGAQFGSVLGNIIDLYADAIGLAILFLIAGIGVFVVPFIIKTFVSIYPAVPQAGHTEPKATGAAEGLKLLLSKPYLMGVFVCSTAYEIIATTFDIQMNTLAKHHFGSPTLMTQFLAKYGLLANILSLVFSLLGTSFLIRNLGLRVCLLVFPVVMGCLAGSVWAFHGLWMLFTAMVITRGLTYSLNNPCRDMMYIPTSRDVRFKTKSWVDTFGARGAKGIGGFIATLFPIMAQLVNYGTVISIAIAGAWFTVATYVGKINHKLVTENKIIE
jgi:AAA family ATP:ADP antiporter